MRIIRACKEMGIGTVAVYSEADKTSLHVQAADEAICIGKSKSSESYLNIANIISVAEITDADAIHPGYGFLAENSHFAEICESCGIKFIGPTADSIEAMGDKVKARELMQQGGVPIIPGSKGSITSKEEAVKFAKKIGYPVIVKAAAGGGGRGMKVCHSDVRLLSAFVTCQQEAEKAFGDPSVYIEKYLEEPHHIEIQVVADNYGNALYLGERDCSVQRRHQKIVEETPSPYVNQKIRKKLGEIAVKAVKTINYRSVGTIEFLMDKNKNFYFMEMNTRIQVEHPVTEEVTGIDLVKLQISLAAGERLKIKQDKVVMNGHAIECRVNAEDVDNNFMPSCGKIDFCCVPGGPGVRVDTHIYSGYTVPPFYDSLLAKVIAKGANRESAIKVMLRALDEFKIEPLKTTIPLHKKILTDADFLRGDYHTSFLSRFYPEWREE